MLKGNISAAQNMGFEALNEIVYVITNKSDIAACIKELALMTDTELNQHIIMSSVPKEDLFPLTAFALGGYVLADSPDDFSFFVNSVTKSGISGLNTMENYAVEKISGGLEPNEIMVAYIRYVRTADRNAYTYLRTEHGRYQTAILASMIESGEIGGNPAIGLTAESAVDATLVQTLQKEIDALKTSLNEYVDFSGKQGKLIEELQLKLNDAVNSVAVAPATPANNEELEKLKVEKQDALNKIAELEATIKTIQADKPANGSDKILKDALDKLAEERDSLLVSVDDLNNKITSLEAVNSEQANEIASLRAQVEENINNLNALSKLKEDNSILQSKYNEVSEKLELLNAKPIESSITNVMQTVLTAVSSDEVEGYELKLKDAQDKYAALQEINISLEEDLEKKKLVIRTLMDKVSGGVSVCGEELIALVGIQATTSHTKEIESLRERLNTAIAQVKELQSAEGNNALTQQRLDTANGKISELEQTVSDLNNKVADGEQRVTELVSEISSLKTEKNNLVDELSVLQNDTSLSEETQAKIESLEAQIADNEIALSELKQEVDTWRTKCESAESAVESLKVKLADATTGDIASLTEKLELAEDKVKSLTIELNQAKDSNKAMDTKAGASTAKLEEKIKYLEEALEQRDEDLLEYSQIGSNSKVSTDNTGDISLQLLPIIDRGTLLTSQSLTVIREIGRNPYLEDILTYLSATLTVALKDTDVTPLILILDKLNDEFKVRHYEELGFAINRSIDNIESPASLIGVTDKFNVQELKALYGLQSRRVIVIVDRYSQTTCAVDRDEADYINLVSMHDYESVACELRGQMVTTYSQSDSEAENIKIIQDFLSLKRELRFAAIAQEKPLKDVVNSVLYKLK